jgi:Fe2+ or Zn2+ uptake regulation protein
LVMITIIKEMDKLPSDNKLRMSKQRKAILRALKDYSCHPTADEIYETVRRQLPHISLGTVYRNLEILSSSGMIRKVQLGGVQMRFDHCTEDHDHIRCVHCGRVDDLTLNPLNPCEEALQKECGYKIIGHCLEFIGICPQCQDDQGGHDAA